MDSAGDILFSSFLAGALLKNRTITYIELTNYISLFEEITNYNIVDDNFDKLIDIIYYSDCLVGLYRDYDDLYSNNCTIKEHLYSMTNSQIRKFFKIEEIKTKEVNTSVVKKPGILRRIKTRVF